MGTFIHTGTADANGVETRFQAKTHIFPSGVLFFYACFESGFPLKIRKTPKTLIPQAAHSVPETVSPATTTPKNTAMAGLTSQPLVVISTVRAMQQLSTARPRQCTTFHWDGQWRYGRGAGFGCTAKCPMTTPVWARRQAGTGCHAKRMGGWIRPHTRAQRAQGVSSGWRAGFGVRDAMEMAKYCVKKKREKARARAIVKGMAAIGDCACPAKHG